MPRYWIDKRPNHYGGREESSKRVQQERRDADAKFSLGKDGYKEAVWLTVPADVRDESVAK